MRGMWEKKSERTEIWEIIYREKGSEKNQIISSKGNLGESSLITEKS